MNEALSGLGPPSELSDEAARALLARQAALQAEAREVLELLGLPVLLRRLGHFEHVGSSASGLLVYPDLDICVRCHRPSVQRVFAVLQPVLTDALVHEVLYRNETGPRSPAGVREDERYYFVLRYSAPSGRIWKIDVTLWMSERSRPHLSEVEELKQRATGDALLAILWIKDEWQRRSDHDQTVGGVDIYSAVLDHGVRTPTEFFAYLAHRAG